MSNHAYTAMLNNDSSASQQVYFLYALSDYVFVASLRYLRERVTRVSRKAKGKVHVPEGLQLPDDVIQVLELGPKFGVQSQRTNPELLTVVRQVSRNATEVLHVDPDVAGATFMAAASSVPAIAASIIAIMVAKAGAIRIFGRES
ncbi:hypothetical protein HPB50_000129 [Hyalomma asiaticum]|uniref:Uncharacterized protein n=1 Tax=Hyalomma asiaticum TaxID=266040 RepID=A0ACB7TA01_HYAAI|nr:hypothetical protein HPB50_000129 [Hyalomma asiaticum]